MGRTAGAERPDVRDLEYTPNVGAPTGVEVEELADLHDRSLRHGNDPYAPLRPRSTS